MRSERSWPMRPQVVIALSAAAIIAACDRPQPTEARGGGSAVAARAAGEATEQSYDMVVESLVDSLPPQVQAFHVERHRTASGWRTHVTKAPKWPGAGPGRNDNQLASIDIDEDGNQTARDATGRSLATEPPPQFKAALDDARSKHSPAVARMLAKRPLQRTTTGGPRVRHALDLVDNIVMSKNETRDKLGKMRAEHGAPRVDALGREHYSRSDRQATVDVVADPKRGVVTDMTRSENGLALERVHYEYDDAGDTSVRRQVKFTRPKTEHHPASTLTITFSRVAVDGMVIQP